MSTLAPIPPPRRAEIQAEAAPLPRAPEQAAAEPASPAAPDAPNPSLRLDPALGLVVLEFRDLHGNTSTLPTERELAAYRSAGGPPERALPPPMPGPAPAAPEGGDRS